MLDPVRAKLGVVGATAVAFAGGVLLASGMEWTTGSHASTLLQASPVPSQQEVRPVAELSEAFISIADAVTPAVVAIETERRAPRGGRGGGQMPEQLREWFPFPEGHPDVQRRPQQASGSGFIISEDGYIVTNNHVVEDADQITVIPQDNRNLRARVVGRDPLTDIAVIKVEGSGFPAVRLGRSEDTKIGEWVLAIGNPLELGTTVTSGIISAKGRDLNNLLAATSQSRWAIEDFIQTDAPINPGNSGGPLVNLRGEVVGVNSAIASPTGFYSGYGFAVPIDLARRVAEDLIRYGKVRRPALGVQVTPVTPEDAEVFGLPRIEGVVVQDFPKDSPAREAGLRQGDVIVGVDGRAVERVGQFQRLVATRRPGEDITLRVIRYGDLREVKVRLAEAPDEALALNPSPQREAPEATARLGIGVQQLNDELRARYRLQGDAGVVVTQVQPFGTAARYGLREGMLILAVDGREVKSAEEFRRIVGSKRPGEVISLRVVSARGESAITNVRLPE